MLFASAVIVSATTGYTCPPATQQGDPNLLPDVYAGKVHYESHVPTCLHVCCVHLLGRGPGGRGWVPIKTLR
jgi:hypothetical protein